MEMMTYQEALYKFAKKIYDVEPEAGMDYFSLEEFQLFFGAAKTYLMCCIDKIEHDKDKIEHDIRYFLTGSDAEAFRTLSMLSVLLTYLIQECENIDNTMNAILKNKMEIKDE